MANKWTIMVYMAGDNNLAEEMIGTLQQVQDKNLNVDLNLAVLYDSGAPKLKKFTKKFTLSKPPVSGGVPVLPLPQQLHTRLDLEEAEFTERVQLPPDTGVKGPYEPKFKNVKLHGIRGILKAFIRETIIEEVKKKNQADHYMLVLSGHGSGAVGDFLGGNRRAFTSLTIRDISRVLKKVKDEFRKGPYAGLGGKYKGIAILGFDSCLMSMTEIAFEVRQSADYLVGAQGFEPDTGWPYARILELFHTLSAQTTAGSLEPENVAKEIVRTYIEDYIDYKDADTSTDQAALDLSRIGDIEHAINNLAVLLQKEIADDVKKDAILLAHWEAQGYKFEQYVDIWDFCSRLYLQCEKMTPVPTKIQEACKAVQDAIDGKERIKKTKPSKGLVLRSCYSGAAFQHSHGVSVFFPWANLTDAAGTSDLDHYSNLDFAERTRWDEFLKAYLQRTQRKVRDGDGEVEANTPGLEESRLNRRAFLFTGKPGKFDPEHNGRFDPEHDGRFDPEHDGRFDPEHDGRSGVSAKIASMKNPPVRWRLSDFGK